MSEMPSPWSQTSWLEEVTGWIQEQTLRIGITINGKIEQPHMRPWSTVLSVPTTQGTLYFKAAAPIIAYEAALTDALVHRRPDVMLKLIASDTQRGWLLSADGGTRLRDKIKVERTLQRWETILPLYAELQIELAAHASELLKLGLPDRRLAQLPELYRMLLSSIVTQCIDREDGLPAAQYQTLHDLIPDFAALCTALAGYAIPASLHHGDFHDGNIFVSDTRYTFFDWGDCSISHPFFSMRTTFVSIENTLGLEEGAPEFERLRDVYLEPWTSYETGANLRAAFKLAQMLSPISSALIWDRILASVNTTDREQYIAAIPNLLREFLGNMATRE